MSINMEVRTRTSDHLARLTRKRPIPDGVSPEHLLLAKVRPGRLYRDTSADIYHSEDRGRQAGYVSLAKRVQVERDSLSSKKAAVVLSLLPGAVVYGAVANFALNNPSIAGDSGSSEVTQAPPAPIHITTPVEANGSASSANAFSSSFRLTPAQRAADVRADIAAIEPVLGKYVVVGKDSIKKITIIGKSSPDAGPNQDMTKPNSGDISLAEQRAADGRTALVEVIEADEAKYGIKIALNPSSVATIGKDEILTPGKDGTAAQLQTIANKYHVPVSTIVQQDNTPGHPGIQAQDAKQMDKWLAGQRGAEFGFTFQAPPTKEKKNNIISNINNFRVDFLTGKELAYMFTVAGGAVFAPMLYNGFIGRLARGVARRKMKEIRKQNKKKE